MRLSLVAEDQRGVDDVVVVQPQGREVVVQRVALRFASMRGVTASVAEGGRRRLFQSMSADGTFQPRGISRGGRINTPRLTTRMAPSLLSSFLTALQAALRVSSTPCACTRQIWRERDCFSGGGHPRMRRERQAAYAASHPATGEPDVLLLFTSRWLASSPVSHVR